MIVERNSNASLLRIDLRGSEAEMGAQHGRILARLGGYQEALDFYPRLPQRLIGSGLPPLIRGPWAERLIALAVRPFVDALQRHRPEEFQARTDAFAQGLGLSPKQGRYVIVMDVFQNIIGLLGKVGYLRAGWPAITATGCCSSMVVWDSASTDGRLRHARNFDFPGIGVWDVNTAVVFCHPDDGLKYGFITTRGADVVGASCFNEAGITLSAHTCFHRQISFSGLSLTDLGHRIIRKAETLRDVFQLASENKVASSWALCVSSAAEREAMVMEIHGGGVSIVRPQPNTSYLPCTNRYRDQTLRGGEVTLSPAFVAQSDARYKRLCARADELVGEGGFTSHALESLLGDIVDADSGCVSAAGNVLSQPITVQSFVTDAESKKIRVSAGPAPTGWGPFVTVPMEWTNGTGTQWYHADDAAEQADECTVNTDDDRLLRTGHQSLQTHEKEAYSYYVMATRAHLLGAPVSELLVLMERATSLDKKAAHFAFLAGVLRLQANDEKQALSHFSHGLEHAKSPFRKAQLLLWASRAAQLMGMGEKAEQYRKELFSNTHPAVSDYQHFARQESSKPLSSRRLRSVALNFMQIEAL